jgi:TetR/AcrR family transcriptional repressor of nem operon
MGRPLSFNQSTARDKALVLFWRKGYQATSLDELLKSMEISRSSFYASFVDKRSLFLDSLDLFARRTQDVVSRARSELAPIDALQRFFERNIVGARGSKASWGCMLVNTVLELADVDDELSARASLHLADIQATFEDCLLDANCEPERAAELAALLMLVNGGVRVASRRKLSTQQQLDPIETAFRLLRSALS